jgi:hypothetical protein
MRRADATPGDHGLDVCARALEDRLDGAVVAVANPTANRQRLCLPAARLTEPDALDVAGDHHPLARGSLCGGHRPGVLLFALPVAISGKLRQL